MRNKLDFFKGVEISVNVYQVFGRTFGMNFWQDIPKRKHLPIHPIGLHYLTMKEIFRHTVAFVS
jgi:hypothetical protein